MIDAVVAVLRYALPVGLAATGETVGQRAGVMNIGLEGMMLSAAFAATLVADASGNALLGLAAGIAAAFGVHQVQNAVVMLGGDQVVVGTAINLASLGVTSTLHRAVYGGSGRLMSLPRLPAVGGVDLVLLATPFLVGWAAWMLARTRRGLVFKAVGEYPPAVAAAGFQVRRVRNDATLIGALFAGLAGAYLVLGVAGSFAENMTAGRGFVAIAMVTFGRWRPLWVVAASLLVGYADSLQFELQARGVGVPPQFLIALPYLVALAVLVVVGKGTAAPAALGVPYRREH